MTAASEWRIGSDCNGGCSDPGSRYCLCYRMRKVDQITTAKVAGQSGRAIWEVAKAVVDESAFVAAWRTYEANTGFRNLPAHDRALIRVAFMSGWRSAKLDA